MGTNITLRSINIKKQHPILELSEDPEDSSATKSKNTEAHVLHAVGQPKTAISSIILATAQVEIIAPNKETIRARILIDQGSEIS